ncbi:MAG TPA: hypothetical protein VNK67_15705 [Burkholderiales bacterium]|nr:hypothetical protein [Burkholderiales bacterium]
MDADNAGIPLSNLSTGDLIRALIALIDGQCPALIIEKGSVVRGGLDKYGGKP